MAEQYWVGDFFIDLTRNQITQKMQSQTIPPKALAVLTCLAKNANKVVSHDELLSEVWPDTIVTPNTLQRSITQLRKVLGEDNQLQSYIKTHAKQGYSLEVEVRWLDEANQESLIEQAQLLKTNTTNIGSEKIEIAEENNALKPQIEIPKHSKPPLPTLGLITLFIGIVLLGFFGVKYFSPAQDFKLSVKELRSLTATDNKELGGIYSPNGEYIVFLRYSKEICINSNIWAKNTKTQQETQLTKNMGHYGSPSFSQDGKKLVFIKTENCNKPITQKDCYNLMNLDFEKAMTAPQSPEVFLECINSRIANPTWLNNNNIALLQKTSNHWKLASYSIKDNKSEVIYSPEDGNLIDYNYSATDDIIALISTHNDSQNYIEILQPDGQLLSSHQIEYPPEIANLRFIYPSFTPTSDQLIFSTGRQLFTLSFKGKITNISLPLDEPMSSPVFHPNGKRMLVIKGIWDSDIATIPLPQATDTQLTQTQAVQPLTQKINEFSIIERSTVGEESAIFQPQGDLIAFKSARSGEEQVWITGGNGTQQLTHFPTDTYIYGMDWAADGQSMLVNANNELTQVFLGARQKNVPYEHRVRQLFQWNSENNTALVTARIKGILKFGELNLSNSAFRVITDKEINWALKSEDGRLVYTDHLDRFWQPGPAEDQLVASLDNQGSDKGFITKDNVIYGINEEFQLWSYDLNEDTFEILLDMPENVNYLTDINQTDILFSIRIISKKEVAELILND